MDINRGLMYCSGDEELYKKNLADFYRDSVRRMEIVRDYALDDTEKYRLEVHALKGVARNIGAVHLSELAYLHEEAVAENNREYIASYLEMLMKQWSTTLTDIENYVGKDNLRDETEVVLNGRSIARKELLLRIKEVIACLLNYETDKAEDRIKDLLQYELDEATRDDLKKAYHEVDDFEYNKAIEQLKTIS